MEEKERRKETEVFRSGITEQSCKLDSNSDVNL